MSLPMRIDLLASRRGLLAAWLLPWAARGGASKVELTAAKAADGLLTKTDWWTR